MAECNFPTCKSHAESNGYCVYHRIYSNSVSVKKKKEIPKESAKMKKTKVILKEMYEVFLSKPENKKCNVKIDDQCTKIATVIHHVRGRIGEQVFNQKDWLSSCSNCNIRLENKHALAVEKGVKKSRYHE